jgi:hypothetical protein
VLLKKSFAPRSMACTAGNAKLAKNEEVGLIQL